MKQYDHFGEYMFDLLFAPLKKGKRAVNQFFIFFKVIGRAFDNLKEDALRVRDETNIATASPVMLPVHGQDRDMPRLAGESVEGYRTRLAMKGIIASWAGTRKGIQYAMFALGYEHSLVLPAYTDYPNHWAEFIVQLGPGKLESISNFFVIYEEIQKVKEGSSRLAQIDFTQKESASILTLGGRMTLMVTLPIPEAPDEMKWLDTLRMGGEMAVVSVLPIPEKS